MFSTDGERKTTVPKLGFYSENSVLLLFLIFTFTGTLSLSLTDRRTQRRLPAGSGEAARGDAEFLHPEGSADGRVDKGGAAGSPRSVVVNL